MRSVTRTLRCTAVRDVAAGVSGVAFGSARRRRERVRFEALRDAEDAESKKLVRAAEEALPPEQLRELERDAADRVRDRYGFLHPPPHIPAWRHFWRELRRYNFAWSLVSDEAPVFELRVRDDGFGGTAAAARTATFVSDSRVENPLSDLLIFACNAAACRIPLGAPVEVGFAPPGAAPRRVLVGTLEMHPMCLPLQGDHHRRANALAQVVTICEHGGDGASAPLLDHVSLQTFAMLQLEATTQFLRQTDIGVPNHVMTPPEQLKEFAELHHFLRRVALMAPREFTLTPTTLSAP